MNSKPCLSDTAFGAFRIEYQLTSDPDMSLQDSEETREKR
jgi:hypothetical protein